MFFHTSPLATGSVPAGGATLITQDRFVGAERVPKEERQRCRSPTMDALRHSAAFECVVASRHGAAVGPAGRVVWGGAAATAGAATGARAWAGTAAAAATAAGGSGWRRLRQRPWRQRPWARLRVCLPAGSSPPLPAAQCRHSRATCRHPDGTTGRIGLHRRGGGAGCWTSVFLFFCFCAVVRLGAAGLWRRSGRLPARLRCFAHPVWSSAGTLRGLFAPVAPPMPPFPRAFDASPSSCTVSRCCFCLARSWCEAGGGGWAGGEDGVVLAAATAATVMPAATATVTSTTAA